MSATVNHKAWTHEEEQRLSELVSLEWTSGQIGAAMNRSRSSIMARAHKNGLQLAGVPTPSNENGPKRVRNKKVGSSQPGPAHSGQQRQEAEHHRLPKICQWIEGEPTPDDSCKCGEPIPAGRVYCDEHKRRATHKTTPATPEPVDGG